jgi:hypothetical protein
VAYLFPFDYFVHRRFPVSLIMNSATLAQLETRLHRIERHNRILVAVVCAAACLAFLGAAKRSGNVITADEVRTQRLLLINDKANVIHEWAVHGNILVEQ